MNAARDDVRIVRPDAPRDTELRVSPVAPLSEYALSRLAPDMLREFRRKVQAEAEAMRAYAVDSTNDELARVLLASAERLEAIIGTVPT